MSLSWIASITPLPAPRVAAPHLADGPHQGGEIPQHPEVGGHHQERERDQRHLHLPGLTVEPPEGMEDAVTPPAE